MTAISTATWPPNPNCCYVCGFDYEPLLHQHHIVPRARGGQDIPSNRVPLCPTCHALAHEMMRLSGDAWDTKELSWYRASVATDAESRFNQWLTGHLTYQAIDRLECIAWRMGKFYVREARRGMTHDRTDD